METIWLHVRAPFAAFRPFQAGGYRSTYPVMPPSVAYGLMLNFAGIEMRGPIQGVITGIRSGLPEMRIAVGLMTRPRVSTIFQQLHSYPVGMTANRLSGRARGTKYLIAPVRRELLAGYDGVVGVQTADRSLARQIRQGVAGEFESERYGLPFLGDNSFMIDQVELLVTPPAAWWYCLVGDEGGARRGACRLTVGIDRLDNSRTTSLVMAPTTEQVIGPPEGAWVMTPGLTLLS